MVLHTWMGCDPRLTPWGALDGPALAKQAQMCNRGYLYQRVVRVPAPEMSVSAYNSESHWMFHLKIKKYIHLLDLVECVSLL